MSGWIIAIPSYNRVDTLKEKTLAVLKQYKIPASKVHIFVANAEQKALYEAGLEKGSYERIVIGEKGLAEARNCIFKAFPKGQHIVELDDDIRGFVEYTPRTKRHERPLRDLAAVFDRGFAECKKAGARLWGMYSVPNGFFMKPTVTTDLKFIIGSAWGCINPGDEIQLDLGGEKEDYQRTIKFWEADGAVVRLNFVAPKTAYYKEPGGMQEGDRVAKQNKTVKKMLKRWPQYIKMNPRRKSGYPEIKLYDGTRKVSRP
jgi:hypothetical protein